MKFIKKLASCFIVSASILAVSVGSTASAYVPSITQRIDYDNATVTCSLMAATTIVASTESTKQFYSLGVQIKKGDTLLAAGSSNNVTYVYTTASHPGGTVSSVHTANKSSSAYTYYTLTA